MFEQADPLRRPRPTRSHFGDGCSQKRPNRFTEGVSEESTCLTVGGGRPSCIVQLHALLQELMQAVERQPTLRQWQEVGEGGESARSLRSSALSSSVLPLCPRRASARGRRGGRSQLAHGINCLGGQRLDEVGLLLGHYAIQCGGWRSTPSSTNRPHKLPDKSTI